MSGDPARALRDALASALGVDPAPAPGANVSTARGRFEGRPVQAAFIDNRVASGAIGAADAARLEEAFAGAQGERVPLVLAIDSAGAKVSEGLAALGAFRRLYRAGLDAALAGVPVAAVLGRNCYGGASMLAHLAARRLFAPTTRLAMSGPAVIAAVTGMDPLDEMYAAMAEAALAPSARAQASAANRVWVPGTELAPWLREALGARDAAAEMRARHGELARRFEAPLREARWEPVQRRDLARLYPDGCEAREFEGLLEGRGTRAGASAPFVGIVGPAPLGAERAWRFAEIAWRHVERPPPALEVFLDCANHAARLEEERRVLTEFIVDMGAALAALARAGTRVGLTVTGKAGGGVYVALAAPAARVASLYGAEIQVLPGSAVAAILGASRDAAPSFEAYRAAGVADDEIRLGLVP